MTVSRGHIERVVFVLERSAAFGCSGLQKAIEPMIEFTASEEVTAVDAREGA